MNREKIFSIREETLILIFGVVAMIFMVAILILSMQTRECVKVQKRIICSSKVCKCLADDGRKITVGDGLVVEGDEVCVKQLQKVYYVKID